MDGEGRRGSEALRRLDRQCLGLAWDAIVADGEDVDPFANSISEMKEKKTKPDDPSEELGFYNLNLYGSVSSEEDEEEGRDQTRKF